jgi:hypothetical protein
MQHMARGYRYVSEALLDGEGLPRQTLFTGQEVQIKESLVHFPDKNPVYALMYLDRVRNELSQPAPNVEARRFEPLLSQLNAELSTQVGLPGSVDVPFTSWQDIAVCAELFRYGGHYAAEFTELMNTQDPRKMDYMRLVGDMYRQTEDAARAFAPRYQPGVVKSMQNLLADAVYGIHQHIANGSRTDATITLSGGDELPLHMEGDEPYQLLRALRAVFDELSKAGNETASRKRIPVKVTSGSFSMYRFIEDGKPLPVSLYVRPYGNKEYDEALEYGKPGEGVEASINYNVDVSGDSDTLIELGKHQRLGVDTRISIRLDREGIRLEDRIEWGPKDPTQQEGMLSLDISSIMGDERSVGTRLGRFLAWGNSLRTKAQGDVTDWNHIRVHFTAADGEAEIFGTQASQLIESLDSRSLDAAEFGRLLAGRTAVVGSLE